MVFVQQEEVETGHQSLFMLICAAHNWEIQKEQADVSSQLRVCANCANCNVCKLFTLLLHPAHNRDVNKVFVILFRAEKGRCCIISEYVHRHMCTVHTRPLN